MIKIRDNPCAVFVDGRREPTTAMLDYMRHIEIWSGVPADEATRHDFWSCHDYIAANAAAAEREYGKAVASRRRERCRTTEFIGGDYGICNNDMGISCFDYGIYPWGDS